MKQNINKRMLDYYRMRHGELQEDLANALGITPAALSLKLNNKQGLSLGDTAFIVNRYNIPAEDVVAIFLS